MDPVRALRWVALAEAVSYLILAGAMVLKYGYSEPLAVRISGMVHGVLFLLLSMLAVQANVQRGWTGAQIRLVLLASLVPIVPFFLDRTVRRWVDETPPQAR